MELSDQLLPAHLRTTNKHNKYPIVRACQMQHSCLNNANPERIAHKLQLWFPMSFKWYPPFVERVATTLYLYYFTWACMFSLPNKPDYSDLPVFLYVKQKALSNIHSFWGQEYVVSFCFIQSSPSVWTSTSVNNAVH